MQRRRVARWLIPLVAAAVLAACGGEGDPVTGIAVADVPRATGALDDAVVLGVNDLGLDLYRQASRHGGNVVLSPVSIATALAMARAGALGATAQEMDRVLHVPDPARLAPGMNALDQAIAARQGTRTKPDGNTGEVAVTSANSLWGQDGLAFEVPFLEVLASQYGAGMRLVDYRETPEDARQAINRWVGDETKDRIPELLAEGTIDDATRLTLVNAVYLKAPWAWPFIEGATQPAPFTRVDGSTVAAPTMVLAERLPYARGDGWQAVELPYIGEELALLVLLPDAGTLTAFEQDLDADQLQAVAAALSPREVTLRLPRWDTEQRLSLRDALSALGMPTAFTSAADFGGMTAAEPLELADVVHQANITVDEQGTEAAAATAVVARVTSAPLDPVELTVDHPFVFALRDRATGAALFLGRVTDPAG